MDGDVFPNTVEYWGPNGMVFYRNVQLRWTPIQGDSSLVFALERPGASGDSGKYSDRIELQNIKGHFPYPDFTAHYRYGRGVGARAAGRESCATSGGPTRCRTSSISRTTRSAGVST